ncbi:MAG: HAD family hydrolase [Tannerellaceae bacterium]
MIDRSEIKAIAFDYGGTLDTPGLNWMEVYMQVFALAGYTLPREAYREAYIYAERRMEQEALVKRDDNFLKTQALKMELQLSYLVAKQMMSLEKGRIKPFAHSLAQVIDRLAALQVERNVPALRALSASYPLLLVSNFYGNLRAVTTEYGIDRYFFSLTDSTLVGIRKPDSDLWRLAILRAGFAPDEVLVVGDSMKNDILPAQKLGCHALLLSGEGEKEDQIASIDELLPLLLYPPK